MRIPAGAGRAPAPAASFQRERTTVCWVALTARSREDVAPYPTMSEGLKARLQAFHP